jgi:precorrin-6B C5,15-methyltransferase / cobalt-precorrin-6B C5,C15-methyltransferase
VPGVVDACWAALRPGGRLVVHAVTLESQAVAARWHGEHGGELTRVQVEHASPLGSFTVWRPALAVVQWSGTKPDGDVDG